MKPIGSILAVILFSITMFAGCSSVKNEYKPLYQVKPEKNMLEED